MDVRMTSEQELPDALRDAMAADGEKLMEALQLLEQLPQVGIAHRFPVYHCRPQCQLPCTPSSHRLPAWSARAFLARPAACLTASSLAASCCEQSATAQWL